MHIKLIILVFSCAVFIQRISGDVGSDFEKDLESDITAANNALDEFVDVFWSWYFVNLNFSLDLKNEIKAEMEQVKVNLAALNISESELNEIYTKIDTSISDTITIFNDLFMRMTRYIVIETQFRDDLNNNLSNLPSTFEIFKTVTTDLNNFWDPTYINVYITIPLAVQTDILTLINGMTGAEVENITTILTSVKDRYTVGRVDANDAKASWDFETLELEEALEVVLQQIPPP